MDKAIYDFINSPNTFDFIIRRTDYLDSFENDKNIMVSQTLKGRYDLCYTDISYLPEIQQILGTSFISSTSILLGIQDTLHLDTAGIIPVQYQPYLDLKGNGVIIGFVDTGIDFTQKIFRYEDGTSKILYIYDQSEKSENPPDGFYIGTEYSNEQINKALSLENPYDAVHQRDTSGHGTFLASVAAGRSDSYDFSGAAPDSEIIAVKLKKAREFYLNRYAISSDTNDVFESNAVILGVEYIVKKAKQLGKPVVICLGLGTNFGSHDGFSIFEEYLSSISNIRGVCICNAAGNECQTRHHMQGKIDKNIKSANIDVKVGTNGGNVYLTIWNSASDIMSASVRSPTGEIVGRLSARSGNTITQKLVLEPSVVSIEYFFPLEGSGDQLTVVRIYDATPGIWTVTVFGDYILNGVFDSWLPLVDFSSKGTEFLSPTPYGTITVPATMIGSISCGAYDHLNNSLYFQSSWGPTRSLAMAPDIIAPGVKITGYYPTGLGAMSGTSVSSAITAGACALLMQWGVILGNDPSLSTYQIKTYLIRGCTRNETMSYPNTQWGYGTLNLIQTFYRLREV
ncbi:MAG: S8 family peptidase [Ruminococcus sp.]|nr:S8 family peptidase [Ruminococcus sp.]